MVVLCSTADEIFDQILNI